MNERYRLATGLQKLCDIAIVVFAFVLDTIVLVHAEKDISIAEFFSMRIKVSNVLIFLAALAICHMSFNLCGLYSSLSRRPGGEVGNVLKAMAINMACFWMFAWHFTIRMITMQFLLVFWILGTVLLTAVRLSLRRIVANRRLHARDLRHLLVLGTNARAVNFARQMISSPERGYRLLGFVDDEWEGTAAFQQTGFTAVSDYAHLADYLRRNVVDEVAVYLPFGSFYRHSSEVARLCSEHGIVMRYDSDVFGLKTARWRAEDFHGKQHITNIMGPAGLWPRLAKRLLDISVASLALLFLSPILMFAAIAILLTSPGPVLFLQERIGLNKRRFKIFKFRTMVPDAEKLMPDLVQHNEAQGPVFKIKNDPRITPIGRFLRKSSIDELPQLLNVLKGDMSLVGPRPLPVRDYEGFSEDWQRRRFSVKPGITCLWQVNGRSGISFEQWMRLDVQYMDEWSLWLDLKILAKTVPAVLKGAGAA